MNNLMTNRHNKAIHVLAKTLLAHPTTHCFTLINAGKIKDHKPDNTTPSWLLPCTCYLPRCKCLARLTPNILCILEVPPINKLQFTPNPNLKVQIFEFMYCNDRFPVEVTNRKRDNTPFSTHSLFQLGWIVLPPIIITHE